jgi:hypothetical protein
MAVSPLQLIEANLDIEGIDVVYVLVTDEFLVDRLSILRFKAGFDVRQP